MSKIEPNVLDPEKFLRDLDWSLLRTFVAIVQVGGISKAAHAIHLTQPSVSAALNGLLWQLPPYENLPKVDVNMALNPLAKLNRAEKAMIEILREKINTTKPSDRDYRGYASYGNHGVLN